MIPPNDDAAGAGAGPVGPSRLVAAVPFLAYTAMAGLVIAIQSVAVRGPGSLQGLSQFDGPEYLGIARHGYQARQLVWFPLYPLLIRALHLLVSDWLWAAVGVTLAFGLLATVAYWAWLRLPRIAVGGAAMALGVFLLYPYAVFLYGVVYSDAVFAALCIVAFVLVERNHLLAAGLVGAVATADRPSGFALVLGLAILVLERNEVLTVRLDGVGWIHRLGVPTAFHRSAWRARHAWVLLAAGGLAAYCTWLWVNWGNPLRFATEQRNYHTAGTATMLKQQYFDAWHQGYDTRYLATSTAQGVLLALFILAVPAVGRRFGWGYAAYTFGLAALPAFSSATFMGSGRYLIPAFPVFALVGEWLSQRRVLAAVWLGVMGGALLLLSYGFSRSWYLG